jgi:predicted deacylase
VRKEDVDAGVSAILRFLRHVGAILGYDEPIRPTPEDLVFRHDARLILKAQREGVVWHHKVLGEMAEEGDTILTILDSHDWQPVGVASPARGRIIYQRDHGLVKAEDTVAMLLPVQA